MNHATASIVVAAMGWLSFNVKRGEVTDGTCLPVGTVTKWTYFHGATFLSSVGFHFARLDPSAITYLIVAARPYMQRSR